MITVAHDFISITKDDNVYLPMKILLTRHHSGTRDIYKKNKKGQTYKFTVNSYNTEYAYEINQDTDEIMIPTGLGKLVAQYFSNYTDSRVMSLPIITDIRDEDIQLPGITLREEQINAVRKAIKTRRLIISMGTGGGKTEIACALITTLRKLSDPNLSMIMLEPSEHLVKSTVNRFKSYGINAVSWSEHRGKPLESNEVVVAMPTSLRNDIRKNPEIAKSVRMVIADECHHASSASWYEVLTSFSNIEYAIGLSATAVSEKCDYSMISEYSIDELKIIGCLGPVRVKITAGDLIEKGSLATPILIRMLNYANEPIPENEYNNWHRISSDVLRSPTRNRLTAKSAMFFAKQNRQVLILVNTIQWARDLLRFLDSYKMSGVCASYGGGVYEECYNGHIQKAENGIDRFKTRDVSILIATTHLYEGADLPDLDVIILAFGGQSDRIQLQGIGRALRKSKTGKYAYIIDFTDTYNGILRHQADIRMSRYKSIVGISDDRIYDNVELKSLIGIFDKLESE